MHVLAKQLESLNVDANVGIGHTRWATHGIPNEVNAHPHFDSKKRFSIVHNGIIENYLSIKSELTDEGFLFRSQTDSEAIVHLIDKYYDGSLVDAVRRAVDRLDGSFALCVISTMDSNEMVACRKNSPLIIGVGSNENYVSSDVNALVAHTKQVIYLDDLQFAQITDQSITITDHAGALIEHVTHQIDWSVEQSEKMGYDFFMQKEIHEQPSVIRGIIDQYLSDGAIHFPSLKLLSLI